MQATPGKESQLLTIHQTPSTLTSACLHCIALYQLGIRSSHFTAEGRECLRGTVTTRYFDFGLSIHIIASGCPILAGIPSEGPGRVTDTQILLRPWLMALPSAGQYTEAGPHAALPCGVRVGTTSAAYFSILISNQRLRKTVFLFISPVLLKRKQIEHIGVH